MDGLRVIVGEEAGGPRSQLWRIWTGGRTSDVYIGSRPVAGEVRVSLHESGNWRYAFTEHHQRRPESLVGPDEDRAKYKWRRPPEFAPGLTRAFVIAIPKSELRPPNGPGLLRKPATWLPISADATEIEIDVFLAHRARPDTWPGKRALATALLYRERLPNGEELIVTRRVVPLDETRRLAIESAKRGAVADRRDVMLRVTEEGPRLRGVLFSVPGPEAAPDLPCAFTDVALDDSTWR